MFQFILNFNLSTNRYHIYWSIDSIVHRFSMIHSVKSMVGLDFVLRVKFFFIVFRQNFEQFSLIDLTNINLFTFFIDNLQTSAHSSIIFGLRELNSTEVDQICSNITLDRPPITNRRYSFTSNYKIRLYSSSCLYLDDESQWRSDGLKVGPLTNLSQTHCLSVET